MEIDYSSANDSSVFQECWFIGGEVKCVEVSRKDYFIAVIKEQSFFNGKAWNQRVKESE